MQFSRITAATGICAGIILSGCVSDRSARTFGEVRAQVAQRAGHRIAWHQTESDFTAAQARIDNLLADGLRLEEAVEIALLNNPRLQSVYESIGIAEAEVVDAMLPPNPSFEVLYKDIRDGGHIWELTAVQEIVNMIMIPWRKKAAERNAERVRAEVTAAVLDVILDVKRAYRRAQSAQQVLAMMKSMLKSDRSAYDMAKRLRDAGNISKLELRAREAVLEQTRLAVSGAELARTERREALTVLLGLRGRSDDWAIASGLPEIPGDPLAPKDLGDAAVDNSLDLAMAGSQLLRALREAGVTDVTSVLPELHVGVESEREPDGTWVGGPMIELPVPIFDWGQAERAIADARVRQAAENYRLTAVKLDSAVRLTARRLAITRDQAARYQETMLPLQKELTEETHLHFNAMQLGVFQLLAAKKEELRVRQRYIEALRDYWIARAEAELLMSGRMVDSSAVAGGAMMSGLGMDGGGDGH